MLIEHALMDVTIHLLLVVENWIAVHQSSNRQRPCLSKSDVPFLLLIKLKEGGTPQELGRPAL